MGFYDYSAQRMNGKDVSMKDYEGKVLMVVNTASKCGLTPQLTGLEALYEKYRDEGFMILGFPCNQFAEQDPDDEVREACLLNYGVKFDMFKQIKVNGDEAHPLYKFLKAEQPAKFNLMKLIPKKEGGDKNDISWNFEKFLIDREGNVVKRIAPTTAPEKIEQDIKDLL